MSLRIPHWVSPSGSANKTRMVTTAMGAKMMAMVRMAMWTMFMTTRAKVRRLSTIRIP